VHARLRGLAILVVIGTAQILTTVVVTLARNGTIQPPVAGIASFAGSAVDRPRRLRHGVSRADGGRRDHPPGAARSRPRHDQLARPADARRPLRRARRRTVERDLRVFAAVIGLLSWLWLAAQLSLVAAEVNVVLDQRLWPRSLFGGLAAADERAHAHGRGGRAARPAPAHRRQL
jgi:hypothetical protein